MQTLVRNFVLWFGILSVYTHANLINSGNGFNTHCSHTHIISKHTRIEYMSMDVHKSVLWQISLLK